MPPQPELGFLPGSEQSTAPACRGKKASVATLHAATLRLRFADAGQGPRLAGKAPQLSQVIFSSTTELNLDYYGI